MTIEDPIHVTLWIVDMLQLAGTQWVMLIDENPLLGLVCIAYGQLSQPTRWCVSDAVCYPLTGSLFIPMLQGASTDVQNNNQQTPLHLAVERQNIQVVRVSPAVRLLILLYNIPYSWKYWRGIKFGGLAVYITTAKLKSAKISYSRICDQIWENPPYGIRARFAQCAFLVAQVEICQSPDFVIYMSNNPSSNCCRLRVLPCTLEMHQEL